MYRACVLTVPVHHLIDWIDWADDCHATVSPSTPSRWHPAQPRRPDEALQESEM